MFKSTKKQKAKSLSQLQQGNLQNRGLKSKKEEARNGKEENRQQKTKSTQGKGELPPDALPLFSGWLLPSWVSLLWTVRLPRSLLYNACSTSAFCFRVVQCSDKGVDKVPYGIPYNSRYILLMNKQHPAGPAQQIHLHDVPRAQEDQTHWQYHWRGLWGDSGTGETPPGQEPPEERASSLEELCSDNNQLSVTSEAVWVRCPKLLVLSLSNNSLGNRSDPLPSGVFSPWSKLRTLNLDHNQLPSTPLASPLSIKELYLKGNRIEQLHGGAFAGISQLMLLDLSANQLTNKGLLSHPRLNATSLQNLNLAGNKLKYVPQHLPRSL